MTKRVSASRYGLAKLCSWAFRDEAVWEQGSSYSSRFGSAFHEAADGWLREGNNYDPVELAITRHALTHGQQNKLAKSLESAYSVIQKFQIERWQSETAHYWHPITGASGSTEDDGTHTYPKAPRGAYAGTVDVKLILDQGTALETPVRVSHVADWKTGFYIEHAKDSAQMQLLGLMLAKQFKLAEICTSILRVRPGEAVAWLSHRLDSAQLQAIEVEARVVHLSLAKPEANPGEHCKRCPAKFTCIYSTVDKEKRR